MGGCGQPVAGCNIDDNPVLAGEVPANAAANLDNVRGLADEIVVVDDEVISKTQELAQAWADKTSGQLGGWFTKVLENQRAYKTLWANAYKYRDSKAPPK